MPKPLHKPEVRPDPRPDPRPTAQQGQASAPSRLSLLRLFKAVFVDQLRLRREGPRLSIELESADPPVAAAPPAATVDPPAARMQRALGDLLDSRADSRSVLKHLAALEHQLKHCKAPFIHDLSSSTLEHMLRQLQGLIAPPASTGVALLLSELIDAAELKARLERDDARSQPISSFFVEHKLEVKELSASALDELGEFGSQR